ncbi:undecaprenyl/decaprenyl-phosphate alpha-N-acetylglucosaminyl 1-phosphate transferase [Candidatus Actinomarina]|nr:undecaprenyl/decaprenyl-phosphate alpha-N-acetylglucosaminyl 1-phosphate transferase [Candidatus Actinomarina sp.]
MTLFQLPIIYTLFLALVLSALLNKVFLNFTKNYKKKVFTSEKRLSNKDIPPFGGIATSFAFLVSTIFLGRADQDFITIGICAVVISLIGLIDDLYNLGWKTKLFIQIFIILYPLVKLNIFLNIESYINRDFQNYLNLTFSLAWILIIINSINFIDNMDGLTVVVSGSICLQIALLANYSNLYKVTDISLVLFATLLGFFIYNYPPAKLYLGDSGTLFVGYILGFISILYDWNPIVTGILISPFSPILFIFTIPILDFLLVITYRITNKQSPAVGGTDHISHRLLNLGYSEKRVLLEFLFLSFISYCLLVATISLGGTLSYLFAVGYLLFFGFNFLKYFKLNPIV